MHGSLKNRDPGKTFELDKKLLKPFQNRSDIIGFIMKKKVLIWQNVEENRLGGERGGNGEKREA